MTTFIIIVALIAALLFIAIALAIRARSVAYDRINRDQMRIDRRIAKREEKLRLRERKHLRLRAKRRLKRMKATRQTKQG